MYAIKKVPKILFYSFPCVTFSLSQAILENDANLLNNFLSLESRRSVLHHYFQVTLRKGYSSADLKLDLANLYQKTGLKNLGTVFLMTDAQVADEKFLVLINNLLASGEIPDLFGDDEVENIVTMVRNEVKGAGLQVVF
jgi:hypothetical protein